MGNKKSNLKSPPEEKELKLNGERLQWGFAELFDESVIKKLQELQPTLKCACLHLESNHLQRCPNLTEFPQFSTLSWLQIQCNSIQQLEIQNIPNTVTWLFASWNKLQNIPDFSQHKLEVLWVSHNLIRSVDANFFPRSLTQLDLRENKLTEVPSLSHLEALEELELSGNKIRAVKIFSFPVKNLKTLHLQENQICTIDNLTSLTTLQKLYLHSNSIQVLCGLPDSLTDVTLANNPLQELKKDCFHSEGLFDVLKSTSTLDGKSLPELALQQNQIENLQVPPLLCFKEGYKSIEHFFNTGCQLKEICEAFKKSLELHDDIFESSRDLCYCESCHCSRGDEPVYMRGVPGKLYALPIGWYRFALVTPARCKQLDAFEQWHRAYHGTAVSSIRKIIEVGDLVPAGVKVMDGKLVSEQPGHYNDNWKPEGFNTKKVFVTPSAKYAGCQAYAKVYRFKLGKCEFKVQVMLQVLIKPGSYSVDGETIGAKGQIDPHFSNDTLEWSTDEHGSTIIYGILVRVLE